MNQLQKDIKSKEFKNFYLLYGDEDYTIINLRNKLREAMGLQEPDLNYAYFYGNDFDQKRCDDLARTAPFFAEQRLIVLENTELFKKASDFADSVMTFPESTICLFIEKRQDADEKKQIVDKRGRLYKFIAKNGTVVECSKTGSSDLLTFVGLQLKKENKVMSKSTATYFLSLINTSLFNVKNELDKLVSYVGDREEITKADVDEITCKLINDQMFKMIDEIALGHKDKVMKMYMELVELRINVNIILANLRNHFKHLVEIKSVGRSVSREDFIKKAGIMPFLYGRYLDQARNFEYDDLKHKLELCVETEFNFKTGQVSDVIGLELLIIELMK